MKTHKEAIDKNKPTSTIIRLGNIDEAVCTAIRVYSHLWQPHIHPVCQIHKKAHRILISSRSRGNYFINYSKGISYTRNCVSPNRKSAFEKAMRFVCTFSLLPHVRIRIREYSDKQCFLVSINDFPLLKSHYKQVTDADGNLESYADTIRKEERKEGDLKSDVQYYASKMLRMIEAAYVPSSVSCYHIDPFMGHDEDITFDYRPSVSNTVPNKTGKYYDNESDNKEKTIPAPVIHPSRSIRAKDKPHKYMHSWIEDWDDRFDHDD